MTIFWSCRNSKNFNTLNLNFNTGLLYGLKRTCESSAQKAYEITEKHQYFYPCYSEPVYQNLKSKTVVSLKIVRKYAVQFKKTTPSIFVKSVKDFVFF